jgi:hypothetical protein
MLQFRLGDPIPRTILIRLPSQDRPDQRPDLGSGDTAEEEKEPGEGP